MQRFEDTEHVVLLDDRGQPSGTAAKRLVHSTNTPLHLGFSCYVVDRQGRVLLTRRADVKATWPGVWTNACCGHPQAGESLRSAVARRLDDELGVTAGRMALAVADFTYRATMDNGVVEHEVCPIVVAEIDGEPTLNLNEVSDASWTTWDALCERTRARPGTLSPWSVAQVAVLGQRLGSPAACLEQCGDDARLNDTILYSLPEPALASADADDPLAPGTAAVEQALTTYIGARTEELVSIDPALGAVAAEIGGLIRAGGKRLRPAFVYWGQRAVGGRNEAATAVVGAAIEMLHTFALLHDDVMDHADTRRGRVAAQRAFTTLHTAEGRSGDAAWFGASAAILAGDLALVWADDLLGQAPLPPGGAARRVRRVFTTLRSEVMAGQYLDLRLDGSRVANEEAARRVAALKSGRYTVRRPLELGMVMCESVDATVEAAIGAYGDSVGLAFQMREDVLDLFGDAALTGKSGLDDLRAGKHTVLISRALSLATPAQRTMLAASLGDRDLDDDGVDACRRIVAESGALASVEAMIRSEAAYACHVVQAASEPTRGALQSLARSVADREY